MAMFAPNAVAVMDTGFPTDDTSVPNAASDLGDGRNCAAQDPYAADSVGFWRSILCARTSGASQPFNWRQCLERPIKPPGICLSACVPLWVSGMEAIGYAASSNLMMRTLAAQQQEKRGGVAQKRRRFLWHCLWMSGASPAF